MNEILYKPRPIFEITTRRIMTLLGNGTLPWRCPLGKAEKSQPMLSLPVNAKTKKPYRGINVMLLWLASRSSPYWATEKTWKKLGGTVLAGESPTEIFFYTFLNGRGKRVPFLRAFQVFNLAQVSGCQELGRRERIVPDFGPAERLIEQSGATIVDAASAWYELAADVIHCPPRHCFRTTVGYYTTKLHELAHWSGHWSRLNRPFGVHQTPEYAYEELIAELTSCFLAATLEVPEALAEMPNHASYLDNWLSLLRKDYQALFSAASAAQRATNYLMQFAIESDCASA